MTYDHPFGMNIITVLLIILALKYIYMLFRTTQLINEDVSYVYAKRDTKHENSTKNYDNYRDEHRYRTDKVKKEKIQISIPGNISRFAADLNFFTNCHDPYLLLDCSQNDTQAVIKKRYRALVRKWHPDHIRGMGATQMELSEATQIVQMINLAYSDVCRKAG